MDITPAIIILVPVLLPIVHKIGLDLTHFGVITIVNFAVGMFTPPVGTTLFTACSISDSKITEIAKSLIPFLASTIIVLLLISFIPQLVLWIPNMFIK